MRLPAGTARPARAALLALMLPLAACEDPAERAAAHHARGLALLEAGEPGRAMLELRSALAADPGFAPAHFAAGRALEAAGDLSGAFAHFRRAADLAPDMVKARVRAASYHLVTGDPEAARTEIAAALRRAPDDADALAVSAALALRAGEHDEARARLDRALAAEPDGRAPRITEIELLAAAGERAAALARADAALGLFPRDPVLHRLRLRLLEEAGETEAVGEQLAAMIGAFPEEPAWRRARAAWAMGAGRPDIAEAELRALAEAAPGETEPVAALVAHVRATRGEAAARAELERLIAAAGEPLPLELLLARYDLETGQRGRAVALLETLSAREGTAADEARLALARIRAAEGDLAALDALVAEVLARDPKNVAALGLRIARLIDRGRLEEALGAVRAALAEAPSDIALLLLEARIQERIGNPGLAGDRLARAVRLSDYAPATVERYAALLGRMGRPEAAATVLSEAVLRHPRSARLLDMLASARVALGRWREAEAAVRALEPLDGPRARALRAAILVGRNRVGEGAALLGRAGGMPEAAPEPGALTAVVSGYLGAGEAGAAEAFLAELLAGDPENLQALGLIGLVHAAAGRAGAAREAQARVLALDPDNAAAIAELARLDAAEGDLAGARARLEAGLGRIPGHPLLMLRLARLRAAAGDAEGALALLERLHARAPDSPGIANDLASLLAETRADDPEAIERAYAIAGRLRDSPEPAHQDTYAWTRHLRGEHREARARLERVVEAVPDNPWPRYHLGMVLLALGEEAAAREALEAALARADGRPFPPAPRIREALAARAPG